MAKAKYEPWLTPRGLEKLRAWAAAGLTNEDIAANCGINRCTLRVWEKEYPTIAAALNEGRECADERVESCLHKRAVGCTVKDIRVEYECGVEVKRIETIREVAPDVTAQIFWLKNRRPDRWRDKQQVEADVSGEIKIDFGAAEELAQ